MGAGRPERGWLTAEETAALLGTKDPRTGLPYVPEGANAETDPTALEAFISEQEHIFSLLSGATWGLVVESEDGGLNVAVHPIPRYQIGATAYAFAGEDPVLLDASETTYIWVDSDEAVETSTTAWPGTDHVKLAIVVTGAASITTITDCRWMNFGVGAANNWWTIAAGGEVDLAGNDLKDLGWIDFDAATELTIASGVITPTQSVHTVSPETGYIDDVDTITAVAGKRRLLLLMEHASPDTITIKDGTGNVNLLNGDCELTSYQGLLLYQYDDNNWIELSRGLLSPTSLANTLDCADHSITSQGRLNFNIAEQTISAGSIPITYGAREYSVMRVDTEADAATDDLVTATGGAEGDWLILYPEHTDRTVVVKHGVGADKFYLNNGLDFEMNTTWHCIAFRHDGTQWVERYRFPVRLEDLVSDEMNDAGDYPSRCIAPPLHVHLAGALSAKVYEESIYCYHACTIRQVAGTAKVGPSGGNCVIDVRVNGVSMFADDSERVNIGDGTTFDQSAVKNKDVTAGQTITFEVLSTGGSPNGAEDVSLDLDVYYAPQTAPAA